MFGLSFFAFQQALITLEIWDDVQKRLARGQKIRKVKQTQDVSMFSGLLRCTDCDTRLAYTTKKLKDSTKGIYRCNRYVSHKKCSPHYLDESDLIIYVLNDIQRYAILWAKERKNRKFPK
jgi:hypothetical protein